MELRLTGHLADVLAREARRRGMSVEALLALLVANGMAEQERIAFYTRLHRSLLDEAEEHYQRGELVQAGEKLWGAICALLNAIGELRRLPHYSHRDYVDIVEILVRETEDLELARLFASAERLHANFYHGFLSRPSFEAHREDALKLVGKLRELLAKAGGGR